MGASNHRLICAKTKSNAAEQRQSHAPKFTEDAMDRAVLVDLSSQNGVLFAAKNALQCQPFVKMTGILITVGAMN